MDHEVAKSDPEKAQGLTEQQLSHEPLCTAPSAVCTPQELVEPIDALDMVISNSTTGLIIHNNKQPPDGGFAAWMVGESFEISLSRTFLTIKC